jgi:hypothetical protein
VKPDLRRWETVTKRGDVVERGDVHGRGFLRLRSHQLGLLYYRGFARPIDDVVAMVPEVFHDRWQQLKDIGQQLRQRQFRLRHLFTRPPIASRSGVSEQLLYVILATRIALGLVAVGLTLVILALVFDDLRTPINYAVVLPFVAAWAAIRNGIWTPDSGWLRRSMSFTFEWYWKFLAIALAGGILDHLVNPRLNL